MSKPYELERAFGTLTPNRELLAELYKKNQKEYIRRRLKAIELLWQGKTRQEVATKLEVDPSTLIEWVRIMVHEGVEAGLKRLAHAKKVKKAGKLTQVQEEELVELVKTKTPQAFGYDQCIFTGKILVEIVEEKWKVAVSDQTIYNVFKRQRWSYQRAHRDYLNADLAEQQAFANELKEEMEQIKEGDEVFFLMNSPLPTAPHSSMVGRQ